MAEFETESGPAHYELRKGVLGWWWRIIGHLLTEDGGKWVGPYSSKEEALSDVRGVVKFYCKEEKSKS